MIRIAKYFLVLITFFTLTTCRKKTDINATAFNYALNEPIANAKVVLVEKHQNGWGNTSCKEIANAVTDANGKCHFDKEKLRINKNYDYYLAISEAYGIGQGYPCDGKTSGFFTPGKTEDVILEASGFDAYIQVQYNNLLSPSQPDDSLFVGIANPIYQVPGKPYPYGGGGVFIAFPFYGCNGFPFPATVVIPTVKTNAGKNTVHIRKRKMGIVTTSIDTVKIYPNETKTIEINW